MEDWAEIRRLHLSEGVSARAIARRLGISRGTVARALASSRPPRYSRPPKGSAVDAFEPAIRALLAEFPDLPASVIGERIGWARSASVLRDRVAQLRPLFASPDPASRTSYSPGELAQCDLWFPPVDVPVGHGQSGTRPVLVMVAGYSRVIAVAMLQARISMRTLAVTPVKPRVIRRGSDLWTPKTSSSCHAGGAERARLGWRREPSGRPTSSSTTTSAQSWATTWAASMPSVSSSSTTVAAWAGSNQSASAGVSVSPRPSRSGAMQRKRGRSSGMTAARCRRRTRRRATAAGADRHRRRGRPRERRRPGCGASSAGLLDQIRRGRSSARRCDLVRPGAGPGGSLSPGEAVEREPDEWCAGDGW